MSFAEIKSKMFDKPRVSFQEELNVGEAWYQADNSQLRADTEGIALRMSPDHEDTCPEWDFIAWGKHFRATVVDDEWLQVGLRYVPRRLDTVEVMKKIQDESAEPKLRALTREGSTECYDDGSQYDGQIVGGERHGQGTWSSEHELYEGQWANDHRHGEGKQVWSDGRAFQGQLQDGKFHGRGRTEWTTPQGIQTYEGEYALDQKHGEGVFSWPDGRCYDGEWVDGQRHGTATFTNPKGATREGIWENDALLRWIAPPVPSASITTATTVSSFGGSDPRPVENDALTDSPRETALEP